MVSGGDELHLFDDDDMAGAVPAGESPASAPEERPDPVVDSEEHEPPQGDPLREQVAPETVEPERSPAEVKLDEARAAAIAGETSRAIELYRQLLLEEPNDMELRSTLGMLYETRGHPDMALEQYEAVRELDPENVGNLVRMANTLAALNRFEVAERELRRAVKLDPACSPAYCGLGVIFFRRGLYAQAEQELKRAIELDQHAALAYHYRGEALNQLSRVDEALAMLERAAQLQPDHARTYYVMGILFDKKNRPQEAAAMFRKAREVTAA